VDKKLETLPQEEDIQKEWDQIGVMNESLQENIGPRRSKENWFREKCKKVLEERNQARLILLKDNQKDARLQGRRQKQVCRREKKR
jgi:hypothetical protein